MACTLSLAASAQWQWVDKTGRKVYSDRPPPSDIPEKSILKQPNSARVTTVTQPAAAAATAAAPASAASAATASASAPKLPTKDSELEAKKKAAEAEEVAKKKAADDKVAAAKTQNCERAKGNLRMLESGRRMQQTNAKGESEFMSDEGRAAETKRMQDVIAQDCAK